MEDVKKLSCQQGRTAALVNGLAIVALVIANHLSGRGDILGSERQRELILFCLIAISSFLVFAVWSAVLAMRSIRIKEDLRWPSIVLFASVFELLVALSKK